MRRDVRRDLCRYRLAVCAKVGSLFRAHVHASEWRIGLRLSPAQQHRSHGRIALPLLNPPSCEDMRLKSSEDVSIETRPPACARQDARDDYQERVFQADRNAGLGYF